MGVLLVKSLKKTFKTKKDIINFKKVRQVILSSNVFKRIKRLEKKNELNFTLLYFSSVRIDLIYSNLSKNDIEELTRYYPILVIRDKERTQKLYKSVIDNFIYSSLNRLSDEKILLIKKHLKNITYREFIEQKDLLVRKIDSILRVVNFVDKIEKKFDENYLTKSNKKLLSSNQEKLLQLKPIQDIDSPIYNNEVIKEENKQISMSKKNIKKLLEKEGCEFLDSFFFEYFDKKTYDIKHKMNLYDSNDMTELIDLFEKANRNLTLNKTVIKYYKEIINKIEFTNLYGYDYLCQNNDNAIGYFFTHIYDKLFKSMEKNKILKLSTVFQGDYLSYLKNDLNRLYETMATRIHYEKMLKHRKDLTDEQLRNLIEYRFFEEHSINLAKSLEFYEKDLIIGQIKHRKA
ncbi:hypothetical protein MLC52_10885 [Sulfurimonas sp. NW15]|uniref:hypothetical protein n=1 Tax=Sulfurimonas sp. NW15 TaxID=2922729 RepID=UPI003DA99ED8